MLSSCGARYVISKTTDNKPLLLRDPKYKFAATIQNRIDLVSVSKYSSIAISLLSDIIVDIEAFGLHGLILSVSEGVLFE